MTDRTTGNNRERPPSAIEAFCGAGGMSIGLERAGFDIRLAFDIEPIAVATFNRNLKPLARVMDARLVSGAQLREVAGLQKEEVDLLSGGPPCQGFSKQRRGAWTLSDPRNSLMLHFARLVKEIEPRAFLFENVEIVGQKRGQNLVPDFFLDLLNYEIYEHFVNCAHFGLAQSRTRYLLVGIRRDLRAREPRFERSVERTTIRDAIGDLPPPPEDFTDHPAYQGHRKCRITHENELRISHVPPGGGWRDIPYELRLACHRRVDVSKGGWPDVYGRLSWDGLCPTVTGGFDSISRGRYAHPEQNRAITPREAARLQGFDDAFHFLGNRADVRAMIGNAVPPPLAKAAGEAIKRSLSDCRNRSRNIQFDLFESEWDREIVAFGPSTGSNALNASRIRQVTN